MDVAGLVKVKVQADLTELDRGFAQARAKSGAFDREASRAFRGVDAAVKNTGRSVKGMAAEAAAANDNVSGSAMRAAASYDLMRARVLALAGAFAVVGASIQPIFAFNDAVAEVSTLVDTATFDMERLEAGALDLAAAFGGGASAQVKAYYQIISAGASSAAQATETLTAANKLAVGGVTSVQIAADGLTSVLNAYGDKVESAAAVSDALFVGMRAGKTTIGELSASLGKVAPLAAQTGVSFDELVASVSALTKGGIATTEAVTGVRAILAAVAKPTSEATKMAAALGIEFNAAGLASKGLAGFIEDLVKKTGGSTDALAQLFGGVEALVPIMALSGQAGADFASILEQMGVKAGSTEEAFNKMANSPGFQAGRMWSALQAEVIGAGGALDALVPIMKAVADNMHLIVTAALIFTAGHLVAAIIPVVAQIAALTAGMGAAAVAARALSLAMAFFGGPIGLAVTALAGAYLLLRDNVSAAEQATRDAKAAYDINERALNDSKAASEGYTMALRNQIAMQVEAARAASIAATAEFEVALARANFVKNLTGYEFAPFTYAVKRADEEILAIDSSLIALEKQLARVDANLKTTTTSGGATGAALGAMGNAAEKAAKEAERLAKAYAAIVRDANQFIAAQELEQQILGMTEEAANRLRYEQELLNQAANDNINLTSDQKAELAGLAGQMAATEAETKRLKDAWNFSKDTAKGFFSDLGRGLEQGKGLWDSFKDAALNALSKIADKLIEMASDQLINSLFDNILGLLGGGGYSPAASAAIASGGGGLYADGGYTGDGPATAAAGVVHKGEYVFSKAATARIGVANLEAMHQGRSGAGRGAAAPAMPALAAMPANSNQPAELKFNFAPVVDARGAQKGPGDEWKLAVKAMQKDFTKNVVKALKEAKVLGMVAA